tara:strand:+ start:5576 stop:6034 length:459 start_codon:yes stop_codon:yes gene_type:complete
MDKNEILSGNKLIAEFMGYEYIPYVKGQTQSPGWWHETSPNLIKGKMPSATKLSNDYFLCRRHDGLRYYNEWNWLMSVVEKIETLDLSNQYDTDNFEGFTINIENTSCYIWLNLKYDPGQRLVAIHNCTHNNKITTVYNAILEFIKWYDGNK